MSTVFIKKALATGAAAVTIASLTSSAAFAWDGGYSGSDGYRSHDDHNCQMKWYNNDGNNYWQMNDNCDSMYGSDNYGHHHHMMHFKHHNNDCHHNDDYGSRYDG